MLYGRPPFSALSTIQKLQAIPNPNFSIPYPVHDDEYGIETITACLQRDIASRAVIRGDKGLLSMRFLQLAPPTTSTESSATPPPLTSPSVVAGSVTMDQVSKIVSMIASSMGGHQLSSAKSKELCTNALKIIGGQDALSLDLPKPPPTTSNNVSADTTSSSPVRPVISGGMFSRTKQMLKSTTTPSASAKKATEVPSSSAVESIENQRPFSSSTRSSTIAASNERKPMAAIPMSLGEQIQNRSASLRNSKQSGASSARWQKQKTPIKPVNPMQAALEKQLATMRNFIRPDEGDDSDSDMEITKTGGDFKKKAVAGVV